MAKQLNVSMKFDADTSQAKAQLQDLQNQLSSLSMKNTTFMNVEKDLNGSIEAAMKLKLVLQEATNINTGKLDLTKFQSSLKQSGMSLSSLKTQLSTLGPEGTRAFASLTQSIQMAELPMFRLSNAATRLWNTFKNTMRWQLASAALHGIASGAQQAVSYMKELDKSLNNIRIVTGMGSKEMADFAVQANKAAKALSTTTTDFTNAALIYYQQGLRGEDVEKRAEITVKMANVTRQSAEEVSSQLTAIWNNFYDGTESLEHYADVLTALGAATASSSAEISTGLEKFAAIANTVGLSYEYAATALATVTAETRQSAEVVGTAFKTLFARIQDLELGETLEDGVTLGKYSEALDKIGVKVLDANGNLRDMNSILDDMGNRWNQIDDATKVAVAQTVGGTRQYAQLIALMDNWQDFKINLNIAELSDGTLQEQQDIFAEGWEGASNRAKASLESLYSSIINDDAMIKLTNGFADFLDIVKTMVKSLGGLPGILTLIFSIATKLVGPQIANGISSLGMSIATIVAPSKAGGKMRAEAAALQAEMAGTGSTREEKAMNQGMGDVGKVTAEYQSRYSQMTEQERKLGQMQIDSLQRAVEYNAELAKRVDLEESELEILESEYQAEVQKTAQQALTSVETEQTNTETQKEASTQHLVDLNKQLEEAKQRQAELDAIAEEHQTTLSRLEEAKEDYTMGYLAAQEDSVDLVRQEAEEKAKAHQEVVASLEKQIQEEQKVKQTLEEKSKILQDYIQKVKSGQITNIDDIKGLKKSSKEYKALAKLLEEVNKKKRDLKNSSDALGKSEGNLARRVKDVNNSIKTSKKHYTSFSTTLTQGLGAVSGFAFGLQGMINAFKALKDPDTSGFEKVLGFITAASFSVPMLTSSFGQLGKMLTGLGENYEILAFKQQTGLNLTEQEIAAQYSHLIGKENLMATEDIEAAKQEVMLGLKAAEVEKTEEEIAVDAVKLAAQKAGKELTEEEVKERAKLFMAQQANVAGDVEETAGEGTLTGAKILHMIAQKLLNKEMLLGLLMMAPYLLLVVAIVGAVILLVQALKKKETEEEKERKRLEEREKAMKALYESSKKATEDAKNAVDDLKSSWDSLTAAKDALSGMVKGSIEWKEQLIKINQQVLDLISKYPELAQYVKEVDGMLSIDPEGYNKVLDKQLDNYNNAVAAQAAASLGYQQAKAEKDAFEAGHAALADIGTIKYTQREKTGTKKVWDNSSSDTGERATRTTTSNGGGSGRGKKKTTTSKGGSNSKGRSYHYETVYGDVEHTADSNDIYNLLKNNSKYTGEYLAKALNDKSSDEWTKLPKALQTALDNNETREAVLKAANTLNSTNKYLQNSPAQIASAISAANSDLLYGENSEFASSKYGVYADDIVEVMTNGFGDVIDSFEDRTEQAFSTIDAGIATWDSSKYGEVQAGGTKTNTDRFRQMYAVEMYGEGAKYRWETDKDGNTKRWIENANGEKVLDFEEEGWDDDAAKQVLANRLASNISEEDLEKVEGLIDSIDNKLDNFDLTEAERQAIVSSTLRSGGENPDFSALSYERLNEMRSQIGDEAYFAAADKKEQNIIKANQKYAENQAANEAKELSEILNTAEMDTTDWENYVKVLQKTNANLATNEEAAKRVAKQNLKTSNAIFKINKAYEDNKDILDDVSQKNTPAYIKAMGDMQDAFNEWFDTSLSYEEIEKLWDDGVIQKAIEGDIEAIKNLSLVAAENILLEFDVNLNDEAFQQDMEVLKSTIQQMQDDWGNIEIGASANVDIQPAIDSLNQLLEANQITAEQATKYLNSIGYDPKIEFKEIKNQLLASGRYVYRTSTDGGPVVESVQEYENYGDIKVPVINAEETNFAGFSAPPTPASTKSSNGKSDKSSGGDRSKKDNKVLDDELDRYHYIREVLDDISNELDKVGKAKDRAFGANKLKNMDKEISIYQKQLAAQKQYVSEIEDYLAKDKAAIAGYGAIFDELGNIANYDQLMGAYVAQYNEGVAKYNAGEIEDEQFEAYEKQYENFKKALDQYEETNNLLQEEGEKLTDIINAIADAKLEKLKYNVQLHLDIDDDELKYIDYMLNRVSDDAFKAAETIALLGEKTEVTMRKVDTLGEGLKGILLNKGFDDSTVAAILGGDFSAIEGKEDLFTEADIEALREYRDALIENAEALQEIRDEVNGKVIEAFDAWMEKINDTAKAFDHLQSVTEHYKNIVGLVGKATLGFSNEMMKSLNNTFIQNATNKLEASRKTLESLQAQSAEAQKALDEARKKGIEADIKAWEETVNHINDQMDEVEEEMLTNWEDALTKIGEIFQENVEMTLETAGQAANGFATFDIMEDQYNKTKEQRAQYLDDYAKMVKLNELQRSINKDIDSTDNIKSQQALRDLQNEINDLQASGVKMSQYDLDYLKKRYELKKAELAIEEAQNTMSTVRMRRDDEGNWGYVYTADASKVDEAKNNYEQKMLEMRDMTNNYIDELGEKIIAARRSMQEEIAAIDRTIFDSDEAYMAEVERITNYYQGQIDYYLSEMQKGLDNNDGLLQLSAEYYATNYADPMIGKNEEFQTSFNETILGTVSGGVESTQEYADAMKTSLETMVGELHTNYETMATQTQGVMEAAGTTVSGYADMVTGKIGNIKTKSDETKTAVETMAQQMEEDIDKKVIPAVKRWQDEWSPKVEDIANKVGKVTKNIGDLIEKIAQLGPINIEVNYPTDWPIKVPEPQPNPVVARVVTEYSSTGDSGGNSTPPLNGGNGDTYTWIVKGYIPQEGGDYGVWRELKSGSETDCKNYYNGFKIRDAQIYNQTYKIIALYKKNNQTGQTVLIESYTLSGSGHGGGQGVTYAGDRAMTFASGGYTGSWFGNKIISDWHNPITGATGMYTGEWGDSGRLAVLHQKELVLNAHDTENFLDGISILRQITNQIDLSAVNSRFQKLQEFIHPRTEITPIRDQLDQNVQITAEFPNAVYHDEIEQAFGNLINLASQYAGRDNN